MAHNSGPSVCPMVHNSGPIVCLMLMTVAQVFFDAHNSGPSVI